MSLATRTILVRNVSSSASSADVRKLFEASGGVEHLLSPASGSYYLVFYDATVVPQAINAFDGHQLKTRKLVVEAVTEDKEFMLLGLMKVDEEEQKDKIYNLPPQVENPSGVSDGTSGVENLTGELLKLSPDDLGTILSVLMNKVGLDKTSQVQQTACQSFASQATGGATVWTSASTSEQHGSTGQQTAGGAVANSLQQTSTSSTTTQSYAFSTVTTVNSQVQKSGSLFAGASQTSAAMPQPQGAMTGLSSANTQSTFTLSSPIQTPGLGTSHYMASPITSQANPLLSSGLAHVLPPAVRLSVFSGDSSGKTEISYRQWKMEIQGLRLEGYSDAHVLGCIRRNVRGAAADLLIPMGDHVSVDGVMRKFDVIFGEVQPTESIMQKFYQASQNSNESVAAWACRLEDILSRVSSFVGSRDEMLRNRFFKGIYDVNLGNALRHHYDNGASYETLLVAARRAETELKSPGTNQKPKVQQVTTQDDNTSKKLDTLLREMTTLKDRLKTLEGKTGPQNTSNSGGQTRATANAQQSGRGRGSHRGSGSSRGGRNNWPDSQVSCDYCKRRGHTEAECRQKLWCDRCDFPGHTKETCRRFLNE